MTPATASSTIVSLPFVVGIFVGHFSRWNFSEKTPQNTSRRDTPTHHSRNRQKVKRGFEWLLCSFFPTVSHWLFGILQNTSSSRGRSNALRIWVSKNKWTKYFVERERKRARHKRRFMRDKDSEIMYEIGRFYRQRPALYWKLTC